MRVDSTFRVMWLLNHTAARKFEIAMMKTIGISEIYTPKVYPSHQNFRSASVDYSEDSSLSIPQNDLQKLNQINWYEDAQREDWELANKYFDICFFILHDINLLKSASKSFSGALLWRAYGLNKDLSYSFLLSQLSEQSGLKWIRQVGRRFFFAQAYDHLDGVEGKHIASRSLLLPLGLNSVSIQDGWQGDDCRILFVCPDIAFNDYYKGIYEDFVKNFSGFPYAIGGAQPIKIEDDSVLGFLPFEEHEKNMQQLRVMFYHSQEPNHIHYHPFEAIRSGMPLVFMAGGMLDRMGGIKLPGRCKSIKEARLKIRRVLDGDKRLIEQIRSSQISLLDAMNFVRLKPFWEKGFQHIKSELDSIRNEEQVRALHTGVSPKRIAVIVPVAYRGGSLRGAKLIAQALSQGSQSAGEPAEIVLVHLDDNESYPDDEFSDLFKNISRRTFHWKTLDAGEARRAMRYAGNPEWEPTSEKYYAIDDGIKQLQDCDLWLVISDRLSKPLLPLRPTIHMIYDYLQRYIPQLLDGVDQPFLDAVRNSERTLVTTEFTKQDALQYAGLQATKVMQLPMLAPTFSRAEIKPKNNNTQYFIWTTNASLHKNHINALKALRVYYEELDGEFSCMVTGVNTSNFLSSPPEHLKTISSQLESNATLREKILWRGELSDYDYQCLLSEANFLWHAGRIDNGTFSVIEAANFGVPSLSSDYPPMREIDQQFALNLAWMDADDPKDMARALKDMEQTHQARRALLPSSEQLAEQSVDNLASAYWKAIRECL